VSHQKLGTAIDSSADPIRKAPWQPLQCKN